jgi:hypothetical protein
MFHNLHIYSQDFRIFSSNHNKKNIKSHFVCGYSETKKLLFAIYIQNQQP